MKQSHFFAHLSRLKLINRWPLMRNVRTENVSEHSLQVAMVAHALATIKNRKFGGNVNAFCFKQQGAAVQDGITVLVFLRLPPDQVEAFGVNVEVHMIFLPAVAADG